MILRSLISATDQQVLKEEQHKGQLMMKMKEFD